ncbi:MAG: carboxymuconolactone decarboxylase family protein [Ginsengibacter sp.]
MRLKEVERGDRIFYRILIPFISFVTKMRLPDAARAVFYHKDFFGEPMSSWTHAAMRGESSWSIGERELIAALTAQWNSCLFCIAAHSAIASRVLGKPVVESTMEDDLTNLSEKMRAVLPFLEKLTKTPGQLTSNDLNALIEKGLQPREVEDAVAVCVLFNITSRCADALGYEMLDEKGFNKAAVMMLERGYNSGMGKQPAHPDHHLMAENLRYSVMEGPAVINSDLRRAIAIRAGGGPAIEDPYDTITEKIGKYAYKVNDSDVNLLVRTSGSEKAAYEVIIVAATGAGLFRWDIVKQLVRKR